MKSVGPSADPSFAPRGPVDWALGKVFLETVGKPLLHMILPDQVDPRDWMTGERIAPVWTSRPMEQAATYQDYWFDFVADTGDSDVAAYALAYLFHGDLAVADPGGLLKQDSPVLSGPLPIVSAGGTEAQVLPRGQLLYVGGDTAYPVADFATIQARFTAPLSYAHTQRFAREPAPQARPLFGIPGNHDWYDNLDGFNRTFRCPTPPVVSPAKSSTPPSAPGGHMPVQQASYVALGLPDGWEIWAFDARDVPVSAEAPGGVDVDHRQRVFFEAQSVRHPPRRLVLATPRPAFVDGYKAGWADGFFKNLPDTARRATTLWFSGDTHHYARYEGAELTDGQRVTSLVSGLGGAALHSPMAGVLEPAKVYPPIAEGARAVVKRLASPIYMLARPGLRWTGATLGLILGAGAVQESGEVGPHLSRRFRADSALEPSPPLVLGVLLLTGLWIALAMRVKHRKGEREARQVPFAERLRSAGIRSLVVPLALLLIAHVGQRPFGSVLLDFGFELTVLVLVLGVGGFLVGGLGQRSSGARRFGLGLLTFCLSALVVGGSSAVALGSDALLSRWQSQQPLLVLLEALASSAAAAVAMLMLFPILAGFALALAFGTGTQRAFISSFSALDRFQSFIRFRLRVRGPHDSSLTGFVISVTRAPSLEQLKNPQTSVGLVPEAEVIDVFTVR